MKNLGTVWGPMVIILATTAHNQTMKDMNKATIIQIGKAIIESLITGGEKMQFLVIQSRKVEKVASRRSRLGEAQSCKS
jgi:hypothetical protein